MWATYSIIKLSFTYIERHWNRSWITFARRISVFILYSSRMKRKLWTKRWITWRRIILNFQYSSTIINYCHVCTIFSCRMHHIFVRFIYAPERSAHRLRIYRFPPSLICVLLQRISFHWYSWMVIRWCTSSVRIISKGFFAMGYIMRKHTGNRIGPNCPHHRPLWRIVSCTDAQP
jgi:hypothetical protein